MGIMDGVVKKAIPKVSLIQQANDTRLCARCWGISSDLENIIVYGRNYKYIFQYKIANAKTEGDTVSSESIIEVCSIRIRHFRNVRI